MPDLVGSQFGYEKVNPAQRKYMKGKRMAKKYGKEKVVNMPRMSMHPMVNCNEAMRKQSQDRSAMGRGEKKDIKGRF